MLHIHTYIHTYVYICVHIVLSGTNIRAMYTHTYIHTCMHTHKIHTKVYADICPLWGVLQSVLISAYRLVKLSHSAERHTQIHSEGICTRVENSGVYMCCACVCVCVWCLSCDGMRYLLRNPAEFVIVYDNIHSAVLMFYPKLGDFQAKICYFRAKLE